MNTNPIVEKLGDRFRCPHCQRIYLDLAGAEDCLANHQLEYVGGTLEDWKVVYNVLTQALMYWDLKFPENRVIANIHKVVRKEPIGGLYLKKRK